MKRIEKIRDNKTGPQGPPGPKGPQGPPGDNRRMPGATGAKVQKVILEQQEQQV